MVKGCRAMGESVLFELYRLGVLGSSVWGLGV